MRIRLGAAPLRLVALLAITAGLAVTIDGLIVRRGRVVAPAPPEAIVTGSSRLAAAPLRSAAAGPADRDAASRFPDEGTANLDFAVRAIALGSDREAWPELAGSLVRADDGAPIPFAEIVVSGWQDMTVEPSVGSHLEPDLSGLEITGCADEHGRFRLRTSVDVLVVVHAPGLAPEAVVVEKSRAGDADLLRLRLRPSVLLEGRVVDASGAPVADAEVKAVGIEKTGGYRFWGGCCGNPRIEWQTRFGQTDDDGRFGPIECFTGGRALFQIIDQEDCYFLPTMTIDEKTAGGRCVELRLPRHARIAGAVRRSDGSAARDVRLRVERRFECWSAVEFETMTNDDGLYSRTLSTPGPYRITLEIYSDEGSWLLLARRDVQLAAGMQTLDFALSVPVAARARTRGDDDAPAHEEPTTGSAFGRIVIGAAEEGESSCTVHLMRGGREVLQTDVGPTGSFDLESVPPGVYAVTVLCAGRVRFNSEPFTVESAKRLSLPDWTLAPSPSIRGRVVAVNGRAVANATVSLEVALPRADDRLDCAPHFEQLAATTSDASGAFSIRHVGAAARLHVEREGALPTIVPIPADASRDELVVAVDATRSVRGRIVSPGGLPSAAVKVSCRIDVPAARLAIVGDSIDPVTTMGEARVAADGTFELANVPTLDCDLELWVNTSGWESMGCTVARRHLVAGSADLDVGAWVLPAEGG